MLTFTNLPFCACCLLCNPFIDDPISQRTLWRCSADVSFVPCHRPLQGPFSLALFRVDKEVEKHIVSCSHQTMPRNTDY